jgi:CPA2 family monovalent cation:H+ antiporter-2
VEHSVALISTLSAGFCAALVFGFLAEKVRMPALVGYLLAGVLISPKFFGLGVDVQLAQQLAEIGIMLLMFGVGLHFSLDDLLRIRYLVIPGTLVQMFLSCCAGFALAGLWDWSPYACFTFGLTLSCASTVVVMKALEVRGLMRSYGGQITTGWLIIQDMVTVLILVLLPPLAVIAHGGAENAVPIWQIILETFARVAAFVALMLLVGKRVLPWLLWQVAKTGSRELFTLSVLACAIGIAYSASILFSVSFALGAFFAGMVMRESRYSHRAAVESLPLRDAFSVIFFVGVGMMFNPDIIVEHPFHLLTALLIVVFFNPVISLLLTVLMRTPLKASMTLAAALGQIGEFSFILAALGISLKLLPEEAMNIVLGVSILSIALNSLAFSAVPYLTEVLKRKSKFMRVAAARPDPLSVLSDSDEHKYLEGHVVLVGFGELGRSIFKKLQEKDIRVAVVDSDVATVEELRGRHIKAVHGEASDPAVLLQAHVQNSSLLLITDSDDLEIRRTAETAKALNPAIEVVVRNHSEEVVQHLEEEKIGKVFNGVEVMSGVMADYVIGRYGKKETAEESSAGA